MKMEDTPIIENAYIEEEEEKAIQQLFLRSSWCYQIPPIDDWSMMHSLEEVFRDPLHLDSFVLDICPFPCGEGECIAQTKLDTEYDEDGYFIYSKANIRIVGSDEQTEDNTDTGDYDTLTDYVWNCPKAKYLHLLEAVEQAKKDMKEQTAWEGIIRDNKIYVFFLPFPSSVIFGLAWKQENNGTTYVWSPVELAYLKEESY